MQAAVEAELSIKHFSMYCGMLTAMPLGGCRTGNVLGDVKIFSRSMQNATLKKTAQSTAG